jgi:hypothetical protein
LQAAVERRDNYQAQMVVKRAIEAIHELDDSRRKPRGELSFAGWNPSEVELWSAHVAARNIAHHQSVGFVRLHGVGRPEQWLRWAIAEQALTRLEQRGKESKRQADAYRARLADRPVLAPLQTLAEKLRGVNFGTQA